MRLKVKLGLAGALLVCLFAAVMWFRGASYVSCWYDGWSLDKETGYLWLRDRCKINRGTKEKPDWIFIEQLRGSSDDSGEGE